MEFNLSKVHLSPSSSETEHVRVLILGAGPAGMSAALYAARAELTPVVLIGTELGGQASLTYMIENYPGFPDGVGGAQLGELFQKQAERFGASFVFDSASAVDLSELPFKVATYGKTYLADSLIIATGASPNHLNIKGEKDLTGKGVSYCATCDGWFFKGKNVAVVGGGDSALEEAIFLTRFATSVSIIHRRDSLRAGAILQRRAQQEPKISFLWNSVVEEVYGDQAVKSLKIRNVQTDQISEMQTDGLFIFIGHTPNTQFLKGQIEMTETGYLVTDNLMRTSVAGVFAGGEANDPHFRQVVTSAGMGAAAAIQATRFLEEHK
jgi:thioredoxin reductase (NADPH)